MILSQDIRLTRDTYRLPRQARIPPVGTMRVTKVHGGREEEGRREARMSPKIRKVRRHEKKQRGSRWTPRRPREERLYRVYGGLYITGDNCSRYKRCARHNERYKRDGCAAREFPTWLGENWRVLCRRRDEEDTVQQNTCTCDPVTRRRRATRDRALVPRVRGIGNEGAAAFGCLTKTAPRTRPRREPGHDNGTPVVARHKTATYIRAHDARNKIP